MPTRRVITFIALSGTLLAHPASAEQINNWIGIGPTGANLSWSTTTNWSTGAAPVSTDDITFNNNGATLNGSAVSPLGTSTNGLNTNNITSFVDANRTVHWLYMDPTNTVGGWHNLYIASGVTLTAQGTDNNGMGPLGDFDNPSGSATVSILNSTETMYIGRKLGADVSGLSTNPTEVSISGPGTLFLNNTNNQMQVRDANSSGGTHPAILDMSALANFNANLARIKIAMGEQNSTNLRAAAIVYLAQSNHLVLSGIYVTNSLSTNLGAAELDDLVFGLNPQNGGNPSQLYWGWSNGIFANSILLGGRKSGGATNAFNPNFTNPTYTNTQATPTAYFRGANGGQVSLFRIGDEFEGSAGTGSSVNVNYLGGIVDISANTMIVGKGQSSSTGGETCTFVDGDGVLNAGNLQFCNQGGSAFTGAVIVNTEFIGTQMTVTNSLAMVVPVPAQRSHARTLNFGLSPDANGVGATLTTLGSVTTGEIDTSQLLDSTINYGLTNSSIVMVNPQPLEASSLVLSGGMISNASYILVTGNGNSVAVGNGYGNSMTILAGGNIVGAPLLDFGARPGSSVTWDVSGIGGAIPGTLVVSNKLQGIGTIFGSVEEAPGATIQASEGTVAGTLTIATGGISNGVGGLTLNTNGNLQFGLSTSGSGANDSIIVGGTLTLLGTNNVNLTALGGSFDTNNPYTLITTTTPLPAGANNYFKASGALGGSRYVLTFDTTTAPDNVELHVSGSGPTNDTWQGGLNANAWDVQTTANWTGGQFFDLDNTFFNDAGSASPAVNVVGSLIPGSMTMNTTNNNYGFTGTGSILVSGAFTANGQGSVTFTNSGGVTFQDALTIASNAVTLGGSGQYTIDGDPSTQIGLTINGGSLTASGNSTVTFANPVQAQTLNVNEGSLVLNNSNPDLFNGSILNLVNTNSFLVFGQPGSVSALCDAVISGSGEVIQNGPGLINLSGANSTLIGETVVNGGTLQLGSGSAVGISGVTVGSGATMDVNGNSVPVPVIAGGLGVGGAGALVSDSGTGGAIHGALTLTTNTSVGGTPSFSFDPVQNNGLLLLNGTLTANSTNATSTNVYNLIKVGGDEVQYDFSSVDTNLANIDVQGGMLHLEGAGGLGNPTNTITVELGTTVAFSSFSDPLGVPIKNWVLNGDGLDSTLLDYGTGATTINGPVTLNGACVFGTAPASRINNGNSGTPGGIVIDGPISGTGSVTIPAVDTWTFAATNTYTGNTVLSGGGTIALSEGGCISNSAQISLQNGGTINASARSDTSLNLSSGQTLATLNNGFVNGILVGNAGSVIQPGGPSTLDVLSVNGNVTLGGNTEMKLDPMLMTNDLLFATNSGNSIQYGGTLTLGNLAGSYAIGQTYQIFSASSYSGVFTNIVPAQPGSGLSWNTNNLVVNGTISIAVGPITGPNTNVSVLKVSLSGTNLVIHGTNNNIPNTSFEYAVLVSPNITNRLSNWTILGTNQFNGTGQFDYTNPIVPGTPRQFIDFEAVP